MTGKHISKDAPSEEWPLKMSGLTHRQIACLDMYTLSHYVAVKVWASL